MEEAELPSNEDESPDVLCREDARCRSNRASQPEKRGSAIVKTAAICWSFTTIGVMVGAWGPSMLNLEILLDTDLRVVGATMMASRIGFFLGSWAGGVLIDRLNQEMLLTSFAVCTALSFAGLPWCAQIYVFSLLQFLRGFGTGALESGGQAYLLSQWQGTTWTGPLLHGLHAVWSIGGTLGPLVIEPFLVDLPWKQTTCTSNSTNDESEVADSLDTNKESTTLRASLGTSGCLSSSEPTDAELVRYGFAIIGAVHASAGLLFCFLFFAQGPSLRPRNACAVNATGPETKPDNGNQDTKYKVILLFMLFLFYFLYPYVETVVTSFLPVFAVRLLSWEIPKASFLASIFFATFCLGRVLSIPLSAKLTPRSMMIGALTSTSATWLVVCLFVQRHDAVLWTAVSLEGLFMASIFSSCSLWVSQFMRYSGIVSAVTFSGVSVGSATALLLTPYLAHTFTYMWLGYLPCLASVALILTFITMHAFASFGLKRGEPRNQTGSKGNLELRSLRTTSKEEGTVTEI